MARFCASGASYSLAFAEHYRVASTRMLARIFLVVLLLCSSISVTPLAFAYPPDPSWISGIYDGDDQDDAVSLVTSASSTVARPPLDSSRPLTVQVGSAVRPHECVLVDGERSSVHTRAPPTL